MTCLSLRLVILMFVVHVLLLRRTLCTPILSHIFLVTNIHH